MKKIIIVAQDYGYCPTSYAFTIARALFAKDHSNRFQIAIVETPIVRTFYELNSDVAINLVPSLPPSTDIDLLISCYEPSAIVEAWLEDKPCIYYCNLLWFWLQNCEVTLDQIEKDINQLIVFKRQGNIKQARDFFSKQFQTKPISTMMYGYFLANQSFCRRFPGCNEVIKKLPATIKSKLTTIGILMPYSLPLSALRENIILFQLSGSTAPTVNLKQKEMYLQGCYQLALTLSQLYPAKQFIFCANQNILNAIPKIKSTANLVVRRSLSQRDQFLYLGQVEAIFTPPGLGTTYEALYAQTPLFFLPEQNIGQYQNWKLLKEIGIQIPAFLANEEFKDKHVVNETDGVRILFYKLEKIFSTRMTQMVAAAKIFLDQQAPRWKEYHQGFMQKFQDEFGQKPFLVGEEVATVFVDAINKMTSSRSAKSHFFNNQPLPSQSHPDASRPYILSRL
jgi:hypothetical protein